MFAPSPKRSPSFLGLALVAVTFTLAGCQRKVPDDIVKKSLEQALRRAPATATAMCGANVRGFSTSKIEVAERRKDNTGVAHIKGKPWLAAGAPNDCEGDIEYAYSYKSRTIGKRTTTTWTLERIKLTAVQTKGVSFKPVDEAPDDAEDDPATTASAAALAPPVTTASVAPATPTPVAVAAPGKATPAAPAQGAAAPTPAVTPAPAAITSVNVEVKNECATKVEYCVASTGSTLNTSLGSNTSTSHSLSPGARVQLKKGGSCGATVFTVPASKDGQKVVICKR